MKDFFVNDFQRQVWEDNYQNQNETIENTQHRLADTIYKDDNEVHRLNAYSALMARRLFFGGRVTANTGTGVQNVHSFNCYAAQRATKPVDSIKNIFTDVHNAAEILKTEGGIGFNFNHIRPKGTLIKGVGVGTPGVCAFMEIYDKSAEIITRGSSEDVIQAGDSATKKKIRKGAQMGMLHIRHPESPDFILAKSVPNMLTKFNMSVIIPDSFMQAVENDENWDFWFPDIHFEKYDEEWNGDFEEWEEKGYPKVIYDTKPAREVWDLIIENTFRRNEPGLYFIDNANRYNNLIYYQKITGTNPCVHPDTLILTNRGWITIKNLTDKFKKDKSIRVITSDENKMLFSSEMHFCGITNTDDKLVKINFSNGEYQLVNKTHKFYDAKYSQKAVIDFKPGEIIFGKNDITVNKISSTELVSDVYDITVTPNLNFFAIMNREEDYSEEQITINGFMKFFQYDLVKTKSGFKFACDLDINDELI